MREGDLKSKILYHGDNYGLIKITPKWMLHKKSRNQEGVGIYFSPDIEVAKSYGKKISMIDIAGRVIKNSRSSFDDVIPESNALNLLRYINQNDEDFWLMLTDYGIEVQDREDVTTWHLQTLLDMMSGQEIRNWQIELAEASNVFTFVEGWNRFINIDGIYDINTEFYAIISTDIPVTTVNF